MSEFTCATTGHRSIRYNLLATASLSALLAVLYLPAAAKAEADDRPTVWIELGGQMEHITGQGDAFVPGFLSVYPESSVLQSTTPVQAQKPIPFNFGWDGKISVEPQGSNWKFSVSVKYGRSANSKNVDHQTKGLHKAKYKSGMPVPSAQYFSQADFANTKLARQQGHLVMDFQAGKDVGLGLFGKDVVSLFSLGVRFAQFTSQETFDLRARPDLQFKYNPSAAAPTHFLVPYFHTYHATGRASRSFRGIGPSLSWNASTPVVGDPQDGELTFDWGVNAAILFGKQKARVKHQETGRYQSPFMNLEGDVYSTVYHNAPPTSIRSRSVTVPNVGGFVGTSVRYTNVKVSSRLSR